MLVKYALKNEVTKKEHERLSKLADIRNRLVHFGKFPEKSTIMNDAILFTHLTEFIIAKILNLSPSNLFNTLEELEDYLKAEVNQNIKK